MSRFGDGSSKCFIVIGDHRDIIGAHNSDRDGMGGGAVVTGDSDVTGNRFIRWQ